MLQETDNAPWKTYLESYFKEDINKIPYYNINKNDYPCFRQPFYTDLFATWANLHYNEPSDTLAYYEQIVWNNSLIKIGGKMAKYTTWKESGIYFIHQLIDKNGKILSKDLLERKYNITCPYLQYESLVHAIPKEWKKQIASDNINSDRNPIFKCNIYYTKDTKEIGSTDTREVYWHFIDKITQRPTSEAKWIEKTELDVTVNEWQIIYKMPYGLTRDINILAFHYKITHRIIACNYQLKIWKIKDSDKCDYCDESDTIEHFFVTCDKSKIFWNSVLKW
jgi:hypothetical protein